LEYLKQSKAKDNNVIFNLPQFGCFCEFLTYINITILTISFSSVSCILSKFIFSDMYIPIGES